MSSIASAISAASATVTPTPTTSWLRNPADPTTDTPVTIPPGGWNPVEPSLSGVFDLIDSPDNVPAVQNGGFGSPRGDLRLRTTDAAAYARVRAHLTSRGVRLLQDVLGRQWYLEFAGGDLRSEQVRAMRSVGEAYPVRHAFDHTVGAVTVAPPA